MLRQTNLYISQWVKLSVIAIQRDVNTLSVRQNSMSTIVRAKSFLSPCYIIVYLSTIFSPIHLFTSYSPFLCSKSSYSLLPVIEKKRPVITSSELAGRNTAKPLGEKTRQSLLTWISSAIPSCLWSFWYTCKNKRRRPWVKTVSQNHIRKWTAVHSKPTISVQILGKIGFVLL